jgi:hypothetical protein
MDRTSLRELMNEDHTRLEQLFQALLDAAEGADQPTLQRIWGDFERGLITHLVAEERYLLPLVETEYPVDAQRLRREHAKIRALVADLGVKTDLHLLRKDKAAELVELLRSHARWEDATLYLRAGRIIDQGRYKGLFKLLFSGERVAS